MPSVGGGHVWPCPLDSLNGKHGLTHLIFTGCLGVPKSLPDDVLEVRVHVGMRAQPVAKEKPRSRRGQVRRRIASPPWGCLPATLILFGRTNGVCIVGPFAR